MWKVYFNKLFKKLCNLQFAINLLILLAIITSIGTIVEQGENVIFYKQNYPENSPILGFMDWKMLIFLKLDHVYTSYWFITLVLTLALSLISCTLNVQIPVLKQTRLWKFFINAQKLQIFNTELFKRYTNNFIYQTHLFYYTLFRQNKKNYVYSGLFSQFGPVMVHISLTLLIVSSFISGFNGWTSQEIISRGEFFHTQNITEFSKISVLPKKIVCRINDFWITYTKNFKISDFYTDLSLLDNFGNEIKRKIIFVNDPLSYKNLTLYQTNWELAGLKLNKNADENHHIPFKKIVKLNQTSWFGSINYTDSSFNQSTFSIIINNLLGKLYIYNNYGKFLQESNLGQNLVIKSYPKIQFLEFLTNTGIQVKVDHTIQIVFFSFFLLMISTYTSFSSHSQIWGLESVLINSLSGTSNRSILFFESKFKKLLSNSTYENT